MANAYIETRKTSTYLTNFALRYKRAESIADFIAPPFKVKKSADKYPIFGKVNHRIYDNKVGRRAPALEISLQTDEGTYECEQYKLKNFVADVDIVDTDDVIRIKENKIKEVKDSQVASREYRVFTLATNTALVSSANAAVLWSTAATATPITDIRNRCIAINNSVGKMPNRIVMSYQTAMYMINTAEWKDMFKYTDTGYGKGLWSAIDGLRNLGLEPKISEMRGLTSLEGCSSDPDWETILGNQVLIYYCEPNPTKDTMTFMYSPYVWKDRVQQWYDNEEAGTYYEIQEYIDELLVAPGAGSLITTVY